MSGHSKWANIKHRKAAVDAKRGKVFTKLIKEITIAARLGGGQFESNPRLRLAIEKAKSESLPKDKIDRAIQKGTGELDGENIEEIAYEGYGPAGVALLIVCATDNKNRTVAEVRNVLTKRGGNMGTSGSVAWLFEKKGVLRVDAKKIKEEELFEMTLDAGAEDIEKDSNVFSITTSFADFHHVKDKLESQNITFLNESGIEMIPKNYIKIGNEEDAKKLVTLIESIEDLDDVQNVWANFDIDDELLEKVSA